MLMRHHRLPTRSRVAYTRLTCRDTYPQSTPFRRPRHTALRRHDATVKGCRLQVRAASTTASVAVKNVAILGGGITGLASAHYISEEYPDAKVTIFESKPTLGGWLRSTVIDVDDGEVTFESGPRSLRPQPPNGTLALRLAQKLGLTDDLLITSLSTPAAQNRFIYYPNRLIRMPRGGAILDNLRTMITEDVFDGLFPALWHEINTPKRPSTLEDESVGSFITRRFNKKIADNLVSALFHGIYAGDIYQLSAKNIMALPWAQEVRHDGLLDGIKDSVVKREAWQFCDDVELQMKLQEGGWSDEMRSKLLDASVFTFKRGIGQLTDALQLSLLQKDNVTIKTSTSVALVDKAPESGGLKISMQPVDQQSDDTTTQDFSHCIATIPSQSIPTLIESSITLPTAVALGSTPAVTVAVVNLYFRTPHLLTTILPPNTNMRHLTPNGLEGFGYLIPRSVPAGANPERALGVIFDSDISPDLHTTVPPAALGTRLTVMLGGHYWDGQASFPDSEECVAMARAVLLRHLGIVEEPAAAVATLQRDCIPQYTVGHSERMADAHRGLRDAFGGTFRVAGSWYTGVGVNDCLRAAYDVVRGLKEENGTGLERFASPRPMALIRRAQKGVLEIIKADEGAKGLGFFGGSEDRP